MFVYFRQKFLSQKKRLPLFGSFYRIKLLIHCIDTFLLNTRLKSYVQRTLLRGFIYLNFFSPFMVSTKLSVSCIYFIYIPLLHIWHRISKITSPSTSLWTSWNSWFFIICKHRSNGSRSADFYLPFLITEEIFSSTFYHLFNNKNKSKWRLIFVLWNCICTIENSQQLFSTIKQKMSLNGILIQIILSSLRFYSRT